MTTLGSRLSHHPLRFLAGAAFMLLVIPVPVFAVCCGCTSAASPTQKICIKTSTTCGTLKDATGNAAIKALADCSIVIDDSQCKPVDSGVCVVGPIDEGQYVAASAAPAAPEETVPGGITPNVPIPGLEFSTDLIKQGGVLRVPYLAQYISAIQRYLIGIVLTAAAVAIVYGGFLYILSSSGAGVQTGKDVIRDALIGLGLVLGSVTILAAINPDVVSPTAIDITQVRRSALADPAAERARVEESARVKPGTDADLQVPVIDVDAPPPLPGAPAVPGAEPSVTPAGAPVFKVGEIAKKPNGDLIAQGDCPEDMVPIRKSDMYPLGNVPSFCIDIYEAPNMGPGTGPEGKGTKPILGVNEYEAEWYCKEIGKRLCNEDEWVRACLGPEGKNTYGYGPEYDVGIWTQPAKPGVPVPLKGDDTPAKCNYDTPIPVPVFSANIGTFFKTTFFFSSEHPSKKPEDSTINPQNPRFSDPVYKKKVEEWYALMKKFDYSEPSGTRASCVTAEGVYDMVGNAQEIVVASNAKNLTTEQRIAKGPIKGGGKPYTWMNFFWAPIAHLGENNAAVTTRPACTQRWGGVHEVTSRSYENGFRCCLDLSM